MPQSGVADIAQGQTLDQRQSERQDLRHWALVTTVETPARVLRSEIRNVSSGGTQILLGEPLPAFALVKIEYDDNLLLGEVVYCRQEEFGYLVGLRIEHALFGVAALADAMQSF